MRKEKCIFWFLQIDKTENINFCQQYKDKESLDLEKNKRIMDKLMNYGVESICWIGDEAIYYPQFIELLKYAKSKDFVCELLFLDNVECDKTVLDQYIEYIDETTIMINAYDDDINKKFGYKENHFSDMINLMWNFITKNKRPNILTMASSLTTEDCKNLKEMIAKFQIGIWKLVEFMPLLLNKELDEKELAISRINYRHYFDFISLHDWRIEYNRMIGQYYVSRRCNIILPNGDIVATNGKNNIWIGNMVNDKISTIRNRFYKKNKEIIPRINDERISILIAHNNKRIVNGIKSSIKNIEYVDLLGVAENAKDAIEKITKLKPEMVFINYNFKDMPGFEMLKEISNNIGIDSPVYNLFSRSIPYEEHLELFRQHKINAGFENQYNEYNHDRIIDLIEAYKEYRDRI